MTTVREYTKFNAKDFSNKAFKKIGESLGDMIVTVAITGITLTYMFNIIPAVYATTIPGMYLMAMIVQLFIRIVHRFDDYDQMQELADRVIEMEQSIKERLDTIINNQMPY